MEIAVRYCSRSGNTRKLAEAIGKAVNSPAREVGAALEGPVDLLFLGGALYGFDVDDALKEFIGGLTPDKVKKAAVFSTAAVAASAYPQIKKRLEARKIPVSGREFHCRGKFTLMHASRPNEKDCAGAGEFARGVAGID
ncbi:MAG: flavodoxin [Clostridiales bacterium]|jgi:flavodoxin|nr:flavodoxin [Clostridiales bacterium]